MRQSIFGDDEIADSVHFKLFSEKFGRTVVDCNVERMDPNIVDKAV